jgi:hypothetical protein
VANYVDLNVGHLPDFGGGHFADIAESPFPAGRAG